MGFLVAASGAGGQQGAESSDRGVELGAAVVRAPSALTAVPLIGQIDVDGRLDDSSWEEAPFAGGFIQQVPMEGEPSSERTEVRVLVDAEAIYVGARLRDDDPSGIVARLARRDEDVHSDWFYVYLDSYRDERTAFAFGVNAAGVQRDLRVADDDREDSSWDAVWESDVSLGAEGWSAEIRIPLSQLRFNAGDGDSRWGVNFVRRIGRKNETAHWAPVPQGGDRFVSLFGELAGIGGLEPSRRLEVVPYTLGRVTRAPGSGEDPFHRDTDPFGSLGLDVRAGLGSSLTLSATLNPDFGQVEADPATVNLTAFETFHTERRPFFVEGADIFELSSPGWPPFFYSRRIGRGPQGSVSTQAEYRDEPRATTILGAAKLSGKTESGWSIGLLNAVTGEERARWVDAAGSLGDNVVEPRTNYAVARVAKELRGGASGVGGMVTSMHRALGGTGMASLHSDAYGFAIDAFHRFRNGEYIANASVLTSHVRGSEEAILRTQRAPGHYFQRPDADHVEVVPTRSALTGTSVTGHVQRVTGSWKWGTYAEVTSPSYEINDLGFNPTLDHQQANLWVRYEDFRPGRIFRNWSLGSFVMGQRTFDGLTKELTNDLGFNFQLRNYWGGGLWIMRHRPAWSPFALRGGPALRKPGRWMGSVNVSSDPRRTVTGNGFVFWEVEDESDGHTLDASASVTVRPSDRMDLRLGPSISLARDDWQFVGTRDVGGDPLYLVGGLDRRTVSLSARLSFTASPDLSFQLYVRPFLASGRYDALREVVDPGATAFGDRFRTYAGDDLGRSDGEYLLDRDGDGASDLAVRDPSFNVASLQTNAVLRWEYRPGSTLFAVWSHDRSTSAETGPDLERDVGRLARAPARNVLMVKLSYWLGM